MLDFIRKNARSLLVKMIFGAIVVVFVFWGVGTFRSQRADLLAKVNGEVVTFKEYQQVYNQLLRGVERMFQGQIPEGFLEQLNLKGQALEEVIRRHLIAQEASKMKIIVTDVEVARVIQQMPAFAERGRFSPERYRLVLRELGLRPEDFEDSVRQSILEDKVRLAVTGPVEVTELEARQWYAFENEGRRFAYIKLDLKDCLPSVNLTEADLITYYEAHKEKYRTPKRIKVRYVLFPYEAFQKKAQPTEEDIKAYYQSHKDKFTVPEERRARHILLKLPATATVEKEEIVKKKAQEILARVKAGEDFARLAKEYSEDLTTKDEGGDLGFFSRGQLVAPFEEAVFSMKAGEIKGPVRTPFGYHIIKLEEIRPEHVRPLAEVKEEIKGRLSQQRFRKLAGEAASKAYDEIIMAGGLEAWAKAKGLKLKETPLFSRDNPPAGPPSAPEFLRAAFSLDEGELSSIITTPSGPVILKVTKVENPHIPPFEKVKDKVAEDLRQEKAAEICQEKAQRLLDEARKTGDLESVARKEGLKIEKTDFFPRKDETAGGALPTTIVARIKGLSPQSPFPEEVLNDGQSLYVLQCLEARPADFSHYDQDKKAFLAKLKTQKRKDIFDLWLKNLREKAEIKVYRRL
ncbi:SurA N-terminal domain-containing protein [Thermosulfuriphilus sp.]